MTRRRPLIKRHPEIDYSYRPSSYFDHHTTLRSTLLHKVKNTRLRQMLINGIERGLAAEELEYLLEAEGTYKLDEFMPFLEAVHPSFMGGNYLPDLRPLEVEIARIEMNSTTRDVISVRAQYVLGGIRYRIVDEYAPRDEAQLTPKLLEARESGNQDEDEFDDYFRSSFELEITHSRLPLSMGRFVELLETARHDDMSSFDYPLPLLYEAINIECASDALDAYSISGFTSISSDFYPDLELHYEKAFRELLPIIDLKDYNWDEIDWITPEEVRTEENPD